MFMFVILVMLVIAALLTWGYCRVPTLKNGKYLSNTLLKVNIIGNIAILPIAFFIGEMATDSDATWDTGYKHFIEGVTFIQSIPIYSLIVCVVVCVWIRKHYAKE